MPHGQLDAALAEPVRRAVLYPAHLYDHDPLLVVFSSIIHQAPPSPKKATPG
ncbi:hypothetical protein JCM19237_1545 [Photobacterium aphoticum]|uniref:Uncharacterized protein n=1 Tax=Photobacterium aphoticum TaxID=754436 RepID=A0A090QRV1_9GAMM|nr:hypothetical protein JCM19237_1545 [Photobacterium aphoticum]